MTYFDYGMVCEMLNEMLRALYTSQHSRKYTSQRSRISLNISFKCVAVLCEMLRVFEHALSFNLRVCFARVSVSKRVIAQNFLELHARLKVYVPEIQVATTMFAFSTYGLHAGQ